MSSTTEIASSFIKGAPPGELNDVVNDIKVLSSDEDPTLITKLKPAFQQYNEDQLISVKLPGAAQPVLVSKHNRLTSSPSSSYYDTASSTSFDFDHLTQRASNSKSYTPDSSNSDLISSILKALKIHFTEHYPSSPTAAFTACQSAASDKEIAILLTNTKASSSNFLSGRWRTAFTYNTATSTLSGTIRVQVHYYEDGNVALTTSKSYQNISGVSASGSQIVQKIAALEKQYQEEVNRALVNMNEGSFKGLRRQLPVTRQRVEWEKVRGYSLGGDLKGEVKH